MTLPCAWERRSPAGLELEALWAEALMILRVVNLIDGHAPREGEAEAATARLEAKLDLALHLLALSLYGRQDPPRQARIELAADGCTLDTGQALQPGDEIVLGLHLTPALALPLKLAATVYASSASETRVHWIAMPEAVRASWEQWLFRQHRRMVQEQRGRK
ncbi:MAG: PilZ domain-containing protein [Thiobacillaceae bacterium]